MLVASFRSFGVRLRARLHRSLRDNATLSELVAAVYLAASLLPRRPYEQAMGWLMAAAKRGHSRALLALLRGRINRHLTAEGGASLRAAKVGWQRYRGSFGRIDQEKDLTTSLLLKAPGASGEKGVLYTSFEYNWARLLAHVDTRRLLRDYYLVGASSSSPTDFTLLAGYAGLSDSPLLIGISNLDDIPSYSLFAPWLESLPIMACDWNDPEDFTPVPPAQRDVDVIMIANWLSLKRHWLLFEALARLPRNLRVVLVGRNADGRTEATIRDEARAFGVRQDLEIHSNLEHHEVTGWLSRSRISLLLTRREGSCVAITESMLADTPVGMMADAHVGARAHINSQTGRILHRRTLARSVASMIEESGSFSPRDWASRNITAQVSSMRLNETLRALAQRERRPWTTDITPMCWRYVPTYLDPSDHARMEPAINDLKSAHGVHLVRFRGERASHKAG